MKLISTLKNLLFCSSLDELSKFYKEDCILFCKDTIEYYTVSKDYKINKVYVPSNYSYDMHSYIKLLLSRPVKPKLKISLWLFTEGTGLTEDGEIIDLHRSEDEAYLDGLLYN